MPDRSSSSLSRTTPGWEGGSREPSIALSNSIKPDANHRYSSYRGPISPPALDGLAISCDYGMPTGIYTSTASDIEPSWGMDAIPIPLDVTRQSYVPAKDPAPVVSSRSRPSSGRSAWIPYNPSGDAAALGWDRNIVPVPRDVTHKPFIPAYDEENDVSSRLDSVLDAYANMYQDYTGEDEEEPVDLDQRESVEPWDTRGKTGLYGGGGRGADDSETGWVTDYLEREGARSARNGSGAEVEEDLRYSDIPTPTTRHQDFLDQYAQDAEGRRGSSDDTQSSYGPVTPISASFEGAPAYPQTVDYRPFVSKVPSFPPPPPRPTRSSNEPDIPLLNQTRSASRGPSSAKSNSPPPPPALVAPRSPAPAPSTRPSTAPAHTGARLRKHSSSCPTSGHPPISAPFPTTPPPAAKLVARPSSSDGLKRSKSTGGGFRWGRGSKKAPVISNPILPDGFVEALGMETFPIALPRNSPHPSTPTAGSPIQNDTPSPSPRRKQTRVGGPPVPALLPPALVRTPLDALRDVGATSPNFPEDEVIHAPIFTQKMFRPTGATGATAPLKLRRASATAPCVVAVVAASLDVKPVILWGVQPQPTPPRKEQKRELRKEEERPREPERPRSQERPRKQQERPSTAPDRSRGRPIVWNIQPDRAMTSPSRREPEIIPGSMFTNPFGGAPAGGRAPVRSGWQ